MEYRIWNAIVSKISQNVSLSQFKATLKNYLLHNSFVCTIFHVSQYLNSRHSKKNYLKNDKALIIFKDYSSSNNCLWPSRMNDAAMTSCFTSILNNTYHVIGDSHVRFTYYYMNMHTGGPTWWEKIHKDIIYEGRVLFWCESCEDMAEGLDRYIQIREADNHRK